MLSRTRAIVLHLAHHKDNADILHLYTRDFGRVNVMVFGVGGRKNMLTKAVLAPLNILSVDSHFDRVETIQRVNAQAIDLIYSNTQTDIKRNAQIIFIAEMLYRLLRHPLSDPQLFDTLELRIRQLDSANQNWHLSVLVELMMSLGVTPQLDEKATMLNMYTGELSRSTSRDIDHFETEETEVLQQLLTGSEVSLSRSVRQTMLRKICRYYEIQIDGFVTPRSLEILQEVFD